MALAILEAALKRESIAWLSCDENCVRAMLVIPSKAGGKFPAKRCLSLLFIPYLLRIKDLQIAEFSCRETLNNEYDDLFAEDIN
ncbi:MAG: hypothetical protein O7D91_04300 [Planctomycetota bacterium]|nr:hypothetical protein [Planctomycetota bacterium]